LGGVSTLNAITFTDHDIGNVGQLQVQDGFTLDGAGTITLNGSSGSPGQFIGIPTGGSYPEWVSAVPGEGVVSLSGLTGALDITSTSGSIDVGADGTTINLNLAESITVSALTIASAGTITLEASAGSPGQYIGIPTDGTTPAWVSPVSSGVSNINGLTGTVDIVSPDGSIFVNAVDGEVNLTQNRDVPISVISLTAAPEVIIPVSGTFYAIVPNATYDTVSFNMSGFSGGTTFTVKNVATTNHNLNIEFNDGTGSVDAVGVNLPLLHPTNSVNSVMALCYWDGTTLYVY
jgi:hypothetical protein